jgi:hypothetical protein
MLNGIRICRPLCWVGWGQDGRGRGLVMADEIILRAYVGGSQLERTIAISNFNCNLKRIRPLKYHETIAHSFLTRWNSQSAH